MSVLKKNRRLFIVVAIIIALIIGLLLYKSLANKHTITDKTSDKNSSVLSNNPKAALTVTTVQVKHTTLDMVVPANGNIAPWQEAVIGSEVNGLMLNDVFVNVGDNVNRGQVLARFASSTISADLAQAQANLAEAKAAAMEAASNANRARGIQNTGALSNQQIEQYISSEASTKARVEAAAAGLNLQNIKLKQANVLAPDNGVISSRTATAGSVASAGQELFRLVRQGRLEWRAELTSAEVSKIKVGMIAELILPDGNLLKGKVRAVAPSIDSQTRNALVYVDINSDSAKAGMYARGKFMIASTDALTLPATAIVIRDGFNYLMEVEADLHVKQIKVKTGRRVGDAVEVLDLTDTGANFVASGGAFLADGDTVRVVDSPNQNSEVQDGKFTDYKASATQTSIQK